MLLHKINFFYYFFYKDAGIDDLCVECLDVLKNLQVLFLFKSL